MEVVDDKQRWLELSEHTMGALEEAHRLERARLLGMEQEGLERPTVARHLAQPPEERGGGGQRNAALGLVADHREALSMGRALLGLSEQPALPTSRLADDDRGGRASSGRPNDFSQRLS